MPHVPISLLTVTKVNGWRLMHRLSLNLSPPRSLHTSFTLDRSMGLRKDCVGLPQPVLFRMYLFHWFWSREVGVPGGRWRWRKVLKPLFHLERWHGASFLAEVWRASSRQAERARKTPSRAAIVPDPCSRGQTGPGEEERHSAASAQQSRCYVFGANLVQRRV